MFDKNFNLTFKFPESTGKKAGSGGRMLAGDKTKPDVVTKTKPRLKPKDGVKTDTTSYSTPTAGVKPKIKSAQKPKTSAKSGSAPGNKSGTRNVATK